jgi:ADP-ribosyl-[dinitrogen reductase] hydrolase
MNLSDRFRGCLLGLAVGDAVGTAVEFKPRGSFSAVTDMMGQGPFRLKAGEWTDDTSMALCLATSLVEQRAFDARDQMDRYCRWHEQGYLSSNGKCFDVGNTVSDALRRYRQTGEPFSGSTAPDSAGNRSIMRLAPVAMFYYPDHELVLRYSAESSRTTHGALECLDACPLLGDILCRAFGGDGKHNVLVGSKPEIVSAPAIRSILAGDYCQQAEAEIRGSGYVVRSLEAALWCFWVTDSFGTAILQPSHGAPQSPKWGARPTAFWRKGVFQRPPRRAIRQCSAKGGRCSC